MYSPRKSEKNSRSKNYGWMQKDTISSLLNNLKDPLSEEVREKAEKVSGYETGVLLYGETGTGKDFWAKYIHQSSGKEKMLNLPPFLRGEARFEQEDILDGLKLTGHFLMHRVFAAQSNSNLPEPRLRLEEKYAEG